MPPTRVDAMRELAKRGKLPEDFKPYYDEAVKRGLIGGETPTVQSPLESAARSLPMFGPLVSAGIDLAKSPGFQKDMGELRDTIVAGVSAPQQLLSGDMPGFQINPDSGRVEQSDEMIEAGLNTGALMMPGTNFPKAGGAALQPTIKAADEFGIPLTTGQRTRTLKQLTREENLRQTDGAGKNVIRHFDEGQRAAIDEAATSIGKKLGQNADNMPEMVTGAIKDKVAFSKGRASELYDIAFDGGLTLRKEALDQLPGFVTQRVVDGSVVIDPAVTPSAALAIKQIQGAVAELGGGVASEAIPLKGIEQIRKRISGLSGSTQEDRRAVGAVKRAFDEWLDDSVDTMLITGDDSALQALKAARAETGVYKSMTTAKKGDAAGSAIVRMQKNDATAEEVGSWLYGANIASPSLNAPKVANRLKTILGASSDEFSAVKAAAWQRLVRDMRNGDMRSATMVANRIEDFLGPKGSTLSKALFSETERDMMSQFASVLRQTVTPRDATNPSRTAYTLARIGGGIVKLLTGLVGFQAGGWLGALAGYVASPIFRSGKNVFDAKRAVVQPVVKPAALAQTRGNALSRNATVPAIGAMNALGGKPQSEERNALMIRA